MRDVLIFGVLLGSLPFILMRPWLGIIMWALISYMNPHRLTWGAAYTFPFAQYIGIATLASLLISRDPKKIIGGGVAVLWLLLVAWWSVTYAFALDREAAGPLWEQTLKVQLFAFLTVVVLQGRFKIDALVYTIVISLGFYAARGAIFALLSGAQYRVWGPADSYIEDNNALAVALLMTVPLMRYLQLTSKAKWIRWGMAAGMAGAGLSVLASQSRGALLAGSGMLLLLWLKSRHKLGLAFAIAVCVPMLLAFMPEKWYDRMHTIQTYEQDRSALGRISAWKFAVNIANERFAGGGFLAFNQANYERFAPDVATQVRATDGRYQGAHSIYFQLLGEHGYVGLGLFLLLGIATWRALTQAVRLSRDREETFWIRDLASMLQVSLVPYAIGGAFLNLAYFDLPYHIVALAILLRYEARKASAEARAKRVGIAPPAGGRAVEGGSTDLPVAAPRP